MDDIKKLMKTQARIREIECKDQLDYILRGAFSISVPTKEQKVLINTIRDCLEKLESTKKS